jgi:hypothetical protein
VPTAQTTVVITGNATGAVNAFQQAQKAASSFASQTTAAIAPLTFGLDKFKAALAAASTVLAGGAIFKASIGAANEWNGQVATLAKSMGTTTEKASVMAVALQHLGLDSELLGKASLELSKKLASNEESFTNLGVRTRDASGALLPAGEIMAAVNGKLSLIKNGVEQNIAAMSVYGESWNEMRGILKLTSDQMSAAEKRAKALGLVIGPEAAAQTRDYKEAQRDLALVSKSLEIQIGEKLLPTMVKMGSFMSTLGIEQGRNFSLAIEAVSFAVRASILALTDMGDALGAMAAQAAALLSGNLTAFKAIGQARDEQAQKNEQIYEKMKADFGKPMAATEEEVAAKRKRLQADLQTALGNLERLRAKAAGEVSDEIVKDDDKATKARIANAEKLRDALRSAWQESIDGARKSAEESKKLLEQAGDTRQAGKDSAAEIRRAQFSAADQLFLNSREATQAGDEATQNALLAKMAAQNGRIDNARKFADQAVKDAERAAKLVEKLSDPEEKARATERLAEAKATADEARAKIKQDESQQLEERAKGQAETIKTIEQQITDLQNRAANLKLSLEISEASAAIQQIQQELAAIPDETVKKVVIQQVTQPAPGENSSAPPDTLTGFWSGGFTGPGGKFDPAGIVHRNEFVTRSEVVLQPGALAFLQRFNALGMKALPGYADGGLVGRLSIGSIPAAAPQRAPAIFNFPEIGRYPVTMAPNDFDRLQDRFARAALQSGGRK